MLSESKADFPKLLYLDQNKWIDLAKAHYGRPGGEPFKEALAAIRTATASAKLLVPFCVVNAVEAMTHSNPERRERLARFMVDLSGNLTIQHGWGLLPHQVRNAVHSFLSSRPQVRLRGFLVYKGLANAFCKRTRVSGGSAEDRANALAHRESPEMTLRLLLECGDDRDQVKESRDHEADTIAFCQRVQKAAAAALTPEQRRGCELAEFFAAPQIHPHLLAALNEAGVELPGFPGPLQIA
jgi:hypothetical protein